jgi:hypothetical protein
MMKLDKNGNFDPWCQPAYGTDSNDEKVIPPKNYYLIPKGETLLAGDIPFDVYVGWIKPKKPPKNPKRCKYPNLYYHRTAISDGRWTAWARPIII